MASVAWYGSIGEARRVEDERRTVDSSWPGVDFYPLKSWEGEDPPLFLVIGRNVKRRTYISSYAITLLYVSELRLAEITR